MPSPFSLLQIGRDPGRHSKKRACWSHAQINGRQPTMAEPQHLKRAHSDQSEHQSDESDDDDDFGPSLPSTESNLPTTDNLESSVGIPKIKSIRKKKKVEHEKVYSILFLHLFILIFSSPFSFPPSSPLASTLPLFPR
jgi:hypothetical protein